MSELFFKNLLRLIAYFFIMAIISIAMVQFLILYLLGQDILFYYAYLGTIWFLTVFASKCFSEYKKFEERSYLFFPAPREDPDPKFEDADLDKLWLWSTGAKWRGLYSSPYECNQVVRKYVRTSLRNLHD